MSPLPPLPEDKHTENLTYNSSLSLYTIVFMEIPEAKNTMAINSQEVLLPCLNLMRMLDQIKEILQSALKA